MRTPMHVSEEAINNLMERGMLPPKNEHPISTRLYARFKAGSDTMTKSEAYEIGNELDALWRRVRELEAAGALLVQQVLSTREALSKPPKQYVQIRPSTGEEPADYVERNWPYEDEQ
jgi:hypothetical protein